MEKEEILNIITKYVQDMCKAENSCHDWYHIERVYKNAMLINKKEQANEFVLSIIVLMHDLYDHKFYNGNIEEKLEETLKQLHVYEYLSTTDIENVIHSCTNLGFSSNFTEKKELSKEGQIAQDADRLDGIGAIGIARVFTYGGERKRPIYDPTNKEPIGEKEYKETGSKTSINHFYDKLLKIKDLMNTEIAKNIAIERHKFLESYLQEFYDEWNGIK